MSCGAHGSPTTAPTADDDLFDSDPLFGDPELADYMRRTSPEYRTPQMRSRDARDRAILSVLDVRPTFYDEAVTARLIPDARFSTYGCAIWAGAVSNGAPVVALPKDVVVGEDGAALVVSARRVVWLAHRGEADGNVMRRCPCRRERCLAVPGLVVRTRKR